MKNLYYIIAIMAIAITGYAQDLQNANWYFGQNAGLTFLPNPNSPTAITNNAMYTIESGATVSDQNGNLLFYTDGATVWNNQNVVMTNGTGLNGHFSNVQGAVIVPRPGYPNNYYLVTIDGVTGGMKGLYYSEIDMSAGYGQVLTSNKNTVLYDNSAVPVPIDANFQNISEKLTSTKHSNGVDYWVITQINDQVYSYLVTASGISATPVASQAPIDHSTVNWTAIGQIKVSPDANRIAVCYYSDSLVITGTNWGALGLGDFNNTTGAVTFDPGLVTIAGHYAFYGVEFSPDSQYVYFTTVSSLSGTTAKSANNLYSEIYAVNALKAGDRTPKMVSRQLVQQTNEVNRSSTPVVSLWYPMGLQLAINGKIYVCDTTTNTTQNSYLSVINDPNNYSSPGFSGFSVFCNAGIGQTAPPWVHWHKKGCPANITRSTPETSDADYVYSQYIIANSAYTVPTGTSVSMQAGKYILLEPNTNIQAGSNYIAFIEDCSASQPSTTKYSEYFENYPRIEYANLQSPKLTASPNPTSGLLLLSGITIKDVAVIDLSGKVVHQASIDKLSESTVDLSNLQQGMYFVKVTATDEKVHTIKVIKN